MTNEERDQLITDIRLDVARIAAGCPGCQDKLTEYRDKLTEHHKTLDGNGTKGHKTRIANLELNVKWLWAVVGGAWMLGLVALQQWLSR